MLSGGACQVRFPCGDTAMFAAGEPIGACPVCGRVPAPLYLICGLDDTTEI